MSQALSSIHPHGKRGGGKTILKLGLCGVGRAGLGMLQKEPLPRDLVRIVAVFDLIRQRAEHLAGAHAAEVYGSYKEMLADPNVDMVIVATRSHEHVKMSMAAIRAGKDVLVEKPIALTLADADRLIKFAKRNKRKLFVRQNRRFDHHFLQAREIVESGKLGKIFSISLRQHSYQHRADWQTLRKFGGGQLLNWGPHVIDWGMRLMNSEAAQVWSDLKQIASAGDSEDHVKILIRGKNECLLDIEISTAAAIAGPQAHILGEHGSLVIDGKKAHMRYLSPRSLRQMRKVRATSNTLKPGFVSPVNLHWIDETFAVAPKKTFSFWKELYKAAKKGEPFPITLEEVRDNMRIIDLARRGTRFTMS